MATIDPIIEQLKCAVGQDYVVHMPEDLIVYEYDGSVDKATPRAVVLPANTQQVSEVMKIAWSHGEPIVARGAGTGLSGGAITEVGGI